MGTSILKIWIENYVRRKREPPIIRIPPLKGKENEGCEGRFQLGGQWKVPLLSGLWKVPLLSGPWKVPSFGGPWKVPLLGDRWKVPCLVAKGRWKEKHLFTSSYFPPNKFYLNFQFFSFDLKVLLYHGSRPLLTHFIPCPWPINYDCASQCNKSTHSLSIWFWLKIWFFSFPWNYGVVHVHVLWALNLSSEWRTTSEVIFKFNTNASSSWWRPRTLRGAHLS